MKVKFLAFAAGLLATAVLGVTQLHVKAALPGQVGSAPRCTVVADGARSSAFSVKNNVATVGFTVSGVQNCKVQLSANSFYAPSMDGRPYNQQILYQRVTKTYTPGHYSTSVELPAKSTAAKGCYYQVDLTYGTYNVTPVLAYGHGTLDCSTAPNPSASCTSIAVTPLSRTSYTFTTRATATNGATISSYTYTVSRAGQVIDTRVVSSTATTNSYTYSQSTPGTYTVKVTVATSLGAQTSASCSASFVVAPLMVEVCDPKTGTIIVVSETDAAKYEPKNSPNCSNIQVCELASNKIITIKKSLFDTKKHTTGACPVRIREQLPEELPETGPIDAALQVVGAASLAGASGYYIASRRRD